MLRSLGRHVTVAGESWKLERQAERDRVRAANPAFLPAHLEVLESPPNPLGRMLLWIVMAFIVIAVAWSWFGHVDVVATAQGKIAPRGEVKLIQASDYGVVRAVHVTEGQQVRAGQPLVELDPTAPKAEVEQARQSLLSAEIDVARSKALVDAAMGRPGAFVAPPGADPALIAVQKEFVAAKIREHETARAALVQDEAQKQGDLAMVQNEERKLQQQLPLATDQLNSLKQLSSKGFYPRLKVSELEERVVGLRQDLAIRQQEQTKSSAAIAGAAQQVAKGDSEFAREALDALTEAEANRSLRAEELKKANGKASLTVLKAPTDGVVQQLQVNTIGGVVKPADPLMIVVPKGAELVVEAMALNRDVGFIHEGDKVEVKFDAFPFTRYGVIHGFIEQVSRDAVKDDKLGLVFPVRVRLLQTSIVADGRSRPLTTGLSATIEAKTGRRRILGYLLSPINQRLTEAGRER